MLNVLYVNVHSKNGIALASIFILFLKSLQKTQYLYYFEKSSGKILIEQGFEIELKIIWFF